MTKIIHCSFDPVKEFIPRIPAQRCEGEDDTIRRICGAPTIYQALAAIPCFAIVLKNMQKLNLPIIVHVYELESRFCICNNMVQRFVPDAKATGECWFIERPEKVKHKAIELTDIDFEYSGNSFILRHVTYHYLPDPENADSWFNLLYSLYKEFPDLKAIKRKREQIAEAGISFRAFLSSVDANEIIKI